MYIDKSNDVVDKYNIIYHRTNKMKPVDVKQSRYVDSSTETNDQNPKFKIGDIVKVSNYKNIFSIGCVPIGQKEFLWLKMLLVMLKMKEGLERFT